MLGKAKTKIITGGYHFSIAVELSLLTDAQIQKPNSPMLTVIALERIHGTGNARIYLSTAATATVPRYGSSSSRSKYLVDHGIGSVPVSR